MNMICMMDFIFQTQSFGICAFLDTIPQILRQIIYYCFMSALIAQFMAFGLDFIGKSHTFEKNNPQRSYYRGLGIFLCFISICQVIYLIVAIDAQIFPDQPQLFKNDDDYDIIVDGVKEPIFRSFYIFNADKFVLTFFLLFVSLPFLTYPLEKYIFAQKQLVLTYVIAAMTPIIPIVRLVEINSYDWFGVKTLPAELNGGKSSLTYLIFSGFWILLMLFLFLSILLLVNLYMRLGSKSPQGSKLRTKSRQVSIGLIIYIIAILTTQNASKELMRMTCADPTWGGLTYLFGFSTPILLLITIYCLRKGFNRDF